MEVLSLPERIAGRLVQLRIDGTEIARLIALEMHAVSRQSHDHLVGRLHVRQHGLQRRDDLLALRLEQARTVVVDRGDEGVLKTRLEQRLLELLDIVDRVRNIARNSSRHFTTPPAGRQGLWVQMHSWSGKSPDW